MKLILGSFRHLRYGPTITFDFLKNAHNVWTLDSSNAKHAVSSLSDNDSYGEIVRLASGERWGDFRSNREYQDVLEHVSYSLACRYLMELGSWNKTLEMLDSDLAAKFSQIGKPPVYRFRIEEKRRPLNPTYLRYLHVAQLIEAKFGSLEEVRVCEIGIGFGGQAAVLARALNPKEIALYDLPEVLSLAKRFLDETSPRAGLSFFDGRNPQQLEADLILSNYAFSELQRSVQLEYMEKVVSNAPRGFMMWNRLSERELGGLSLEEFLKFIPQAEVEHESPKSYAGNVLITWGSRQV